MNLRAGGEPSDAERLAVLEVEGITDGGWLPERLRSAAAAGSGLAMAPAGT